jgi:hypothetical protein
MQYNYALQDIKTKRNRRHSIGEIRRSRAVVRDLQMRDLVQFFPGATCYSLARVSCQSKASVRERLRLLAGAGLIDVRIDGDVHRAYPVPMEGQ